MIYSSTTVTELPVHFPVLALFFFEIELDMKLMPFPIHPGPTTVVVIRIGKLAGLVCTVPLSIVHLAFHVLPIRRCFIMEYIESRILSYTVTDDMPTYTSSHQCSTRQMNHISTTSIYHHIRLLRGLISLKSVCRDLSLRLCQRTLKNVHKRSILDGRRGRLIANEERTPRASPSVLFFMATLSV